MTDPAASSREAPPQIVPLFGRCDFCCEPALLRSATDRWGVWHEAICARCRYALGCAGAREVV